MLSGPTTADSDPYALASARYRRDGYVVLHEFASAEQCDLLADLARRDLEPLVGPAEFEADVGYPGAPRSRDDAGGATPRRLLHAYSRDAAFRRFATRSDLRAVLAGTTRW